MAEAGLGDGFATELYFQNVDPWPRMAQSIQQDLAAIGIKAELRGLDLAAFVGVGGKPDGTPMTVTEWYADFPDPSNFYTPILGCAGAVEGGYNWSWYCNKDIDARAKAADAIADPARAQERLDTWKQDHGGHHGQGRRLGAVVQSEPLLAALGAAEGRHQPVQ